MRCLVKLGRRLRRAVRRARRTLFRGRRVPSAHASRRREATPAARIASAVVNAEIALTAALLALCYGGLPFGIEAMNVATGSMEPAVPQGSLAYVRHVEDGGSSVSPGDVVAFSTGEHGRATVLHRVVQVDAERGTVTTKGDANDAPDPFDVPLDAIVGTLEGSLPFLGGALGAFSEHKVAALGAVAAANVAVIAAAHGSRPRGAHHGDDTPRTDWRASCTCSERTLHRECR